tara:strand:+ start:514 stop:1137 length:624 start_codon:yes stop_codon:yes gene_type:complete
MIELVVFDLWNTLVFKDAPYDPTIELPKRFNLGDPTAVNKKFEHAIQLRSWPSKEEAYRNVCVELGIPPNSENIAWVIKLRDDSESAAKAFPHVQNMLEQLKSKGYKIGLASNSSTFAAENVQKGTSVLDFIDFPVFSFDVGEIKPGVKMFAKVLADANCKPENAVMIGDKLEDDVEPAQSIGMHGIHYTSYEQLKKDFSKLGVELE